MFLAKMNLATVSSSMEGDEPGSQTGVFKYAGRVVATKQSLLVTVEWDGSKNGGTFKVRASACAASCCSS